LIVIRNRDIIIKFLTNAKKLIIIELIDINMITNDFEKLFFIISIIKEI